MGKNKHKNYGVTKGQWTGNEEQAQNLPRPDEKLTDDTSSDELAEDPTELRVGELDISEPLPPGKIEPIDYEKLEARAFSALFSNYEKLYEQIDLLERGKIGTWQAAFDIVKEIRKIKG